MAYGVLTNAALLSIGLAPAQASALVHTAEIFTTGASAASHIYHRNVDWRFVSRLGVAGVLGADSRRLDSVECRCHGGAPLRLRLSSADGRLHPVALGADRADPRASGRLDAAGRLRCRLPRCQRRRRLGPVLTSTLVGSGHAPRQTVGSVNTAEFFVTVASATTFFVELGASPLQQLVPLVIGGLLAAPVGGWAVQAHFRAAADDRGRIADRAVVAVPARPSVQADLSQTAVLTAPSRSACRPAAAPTSGSALARRSASAPPAAW